MTLLNISWTSFYTAGIRGCTLQICSDVFSLLREFKKGRGGVFFNFFKEDNRSKIAVEKGLVQASEKRLL